MSKTWRSGERRKTCVFCISNTTVQREKQFVIISDLIFRHKNLTLIRLIIFKGCITYIEYRSNTLISYYCLIFLQKIVGWFFTFVHVPYCCDLILGFIRSSFDFCHCDTDLVQNIKVAKSLLKDSKKFIDKTCV